MSTAELILGACTKEAIDTCVDRLQRKVPIALLHPKLTAPERASLAEEVRRHDARDAAAIIFTSGSTGRPRGAILDAENFRASARATIRALDLDHRDRWLLALPLAHVGGFSILTRCLLARAMIVLPEDPAHFDARTIASTIAKDRVTIASFVPTMLHRMFELGWDPPRHLRAILLGGAPAPAKLLDRARDRRWPILTTYGLTEACSQVTMQPLGSAPGAIEGAGRALDRVELELDAGGEIHLRGPMMFRGYLGDPHPRDPHAWFATGDLGRLDGEGRLFVEGRKRDLIITGGENVHPTEVEEALAAAPDVRAVCVVGVPDEEWGEVVCAAIVPEHEGAIDESELRAFAAANLAPHKRPRRIAVVRELPLLPSGKIDRNKTRGFVITRA